MGWATFRKDPGGIFNFGRSEFGWATSRTDLDDIYVFLFFVSRGFYVISRVVPALIFCLGRSELGWVSTPQRRPIYVCILRIPSALLSLSRVA